MKQPALQQLLNDAQSAWPDLTLDPEQFADLLERRLSDATDAKVVDGDGLLHAADLYLAYGCALGDALAIKKFDAVYGVELRSLASRFATRAMSAEDLEQILLTKLFVDQPPRQARIREYSGRGALRAWLRVTALRTFLDETKRGKGREVGMTGSMVLGLPGDQDPELDFLKAHYRDHFKQAFVGAVESLSSSARSLLRLRVVSGLDAEQIAAVLGVHRATTDRRLAKAREALLRSTRRELMSRLAVDGDEFERIMSLIQSRLEVSLPRLLAASLISLREGVCG